MKRGLVIPLLSFALVIPALAAGAPAYRDGTYALDYQDPELGNVSVSVVVEQGKIASVSFPKGKGDVALEDADLDAWLKTFLAAPDLLAVDAISGATQSCDLVKYAVAAALKGAQLK
jgi:Major membrane immunogen, membrane-anchored lipoprotein